MALGPRQRPIRRGRKQRGPTLSRVFIHSSILDIDIYALEFYSIRLAMNFPLVSKESSLAL